MHLRCTINLNQGAQKPTLIWTKISKIIICHTMPCHNQKFSFFLIFSMEKLPSAWECFRPCEQHFFYKPILFVTRGSLMLQVRRDLFSKLDEEAGKRFPLRRRKLDPNLLHLFMFWLKLTEVKNEVRRNLEKFKCLSVQNYIGLTCLLKVKVMQTIYYFN